MFKPEHVEKLEKAKTLLDEVLTESTLTGSNREEFFKVLEAWCAVNEITSKEG